MLRLVLVLHGAGLLQPLTCRCKRGRLVTRSPSLQAYETLVLLQCVLPLTDRHLSHAEHMPEFTTGACHTSQNTIIHSLLSFGALLTQIPPVQSLQ